MTQCVSPPPLSRHVTRQPPHATSHRPRPRHGTHRHDLLQLHSTPATHRATATHPRHTGATDSDCPHTSASSHYTAMTWHGDARNLNQASTKPQHDPCRQRCQPPPPWTRRPIHTTSCTLHAPHWRPDCQAPSHSYARTTAATLMCASSAAHASTTRPQPTRPAVPLHNTPRPVSPSVSPSQSSSHQVHATLSNACIIASTSTATPSRTLHPDLRHHASYRH